MKIQFNRHYFLLAIAIFLVELLIGFYGSGFIRTFVGDLLVVVLLYLLLKSVWNTSPFNVAMSVLLFSFGVEIAQYFDVVNLLGLTGNRMAEIIIGTRFDWWDLLAYSLGTLLIYFLDTKYIMPHLYHK